jgi:hypothetical protein
MITVNFLQAGRRSEDDVIHLYSSQRGAFKNDTIFHNNDYSTVLRIPRWVMRENFKYEAKSGCYVNLTGITYKNLRKLVTLGTPIELLIHKQD